MTWQAVTIETVLAAMAIATAVAVHGWWRAHRLNCKLHEQRRVSDCLAAELGKANRELEQSRTFPQKGSKDAR